MDQIDNFWNNCETKLLKFDNEGLIKFYNDQQLNDQMCDFQSLYLGPRFTTHIVKHVQNNGVLLIC